MATTEHIASVWNRVLQNNKRPPGYTLGYVFATWDQRLHMVASGTAVELMTFAWIKTVMSHVAPVKTEMNPKRTATMSFRVVMGSSCLCAGTWRRKNNCSWRR